MLLIVIANFMLGMAFGTRFGVGALSILVLVSPLEALAIRLATQPWYVVLWHGIQLLVAIEVGYVSGLLTKSFPGAFPLWLGTSRLNSGSPDDVSRPARSEP